MAARVKVRRFCVLLSYCGKDYQGMQRNPGTKSVEEFFLSALKQTGLISEECYNRPQLMYFQRAARTDKGVSAIKQTISLKVAESIQTRLDDVNRLMPPDIKLMGVRRVTQSFDAKNYCDARTYAYLMPSFVLCPISDATKESYRAPKEIIDKFNSILSGYLGTHVFHNFTSGKKFTEDSSSRVIRAISCSQPFYPCNQKELEFVVVRIKGQSFMMHQIRKMIGLAIAVVKGFATEEHINRSMEAPFMDVPKAPGLGLMLEEVHFDTYNKKFGGDGHHDPIDWQSENDNIEQFKEEYIYPVVVETELKEKPMFNWLHTLSLHRYGSDDLTESTIQAADRISDLGYKQKSKEGRELSETSISVKRTKLDVDSDIKEDDLIDNKKEAQKIDS